MDDGYQELSPADGLGIVGTDAGPHVEQASVDDEQQDEGDDAAVDEDLIALADARIALAVNGAEEDGGHDEADQDVARIVAAEEGIDEGIVCGRFRRRPQGEENPGNGDGHQNEGQGRRQILAHAVHNVMRVGDEEIAEQEIDDNQGNHGRCRKIPLYAELDGRRRRPRNGHEGTDQHQSRQENAVRIFSDLVRNRMDVAVEADDDERKNRQENPRQGQAGQARQEITAAVEPQVRRKNKIAGPEIGGKKSKAQDDDIPFPNRLSAGIIHKKSPPNPIIKNKCIIQKKRRCLQAAPQFTSYLSGIACRNWHLTIGRLPQRHRAHPSAALDIAV